MTLPLDGFHMNKAARDGLQQWCKTCQLEANRGRPSGVVQLRLKAVAVLGSSCVSCGWTDVRALQIDHIEGGGSREFRSKGNRAVYKAISMGETAGFQLLCANCNWIKKHTNGEAGDYYDASVRACVTL